MIILGSRLGLLITVPSHMASSNSTCSTKHRLLGYCRLAAWSPLFLSTQLSITPTMSISSSIPLSLLVYHCGAASTLGQTRRITIVLFGKFVMFFDRESPNAPRAFTLRIRGMQKGKRKTFYTFCPRTDTPKESLLRYCRNRQMGCECKP